MEGLERMSCGARVFESLRICDGVVLGCGDTSYMYVAWGKDCITGVGETSILRVRPGVQV